MPRSNRRREEPTDLGLERLLSGWKRTETVRGVSWYVQPIAASQAKKLYSCPGCGRTIEPATAHLVIWRADGVLGDAADLSARRHWHTSCWPR